MAESKYVPPAMRGAGHAGGSYDLPNEAHHENRAGGGYYDRQNHYQNQRY